MAAPKSPFAIGVIIMGGFIAAVIFGLNATQGMPVADRKTVKVAFDDLSGLNVGDDVRIASSRVGYVQDLRLENGSAVAVLELDDPETKLYENAKVARVADRSGFGQKYVNLDPGSPKTGPLRGDATISADQSVKAENISELFDTFDSPTRDGISGTLTQFGGGMAGHSQDMNAIIKSSPELLEDTGTISQALAANRGASLASFLESSQRLSARFDGREQQLADLTRQMGTTLEALGVDDTIQARDTIDRAPESLSEARTALNQLNAPLAKTESAMTEIRPGASALGDAVPDLRGVLRESVRPLKRLPQVNKVAKPAVSELTPLVSDARPLARQLIGTGKYAARPVGVLEPYRMDISDFYTQAASSLSRGDSAGNWLRIMLLPGGESVAGGPPPGRNPYPEPGMASQDKSRANGGVR